MLLCNAHDVIKMITAIFKREIDNETIEEEVSANLYTVTHYGKKIYSVGGYKYSGYYDNEKGIVIIDGNEVSDAIDYDDESDYYDNLYYADGY